MTVPQVVIHTFKGHQLIWTQFDTVVPVVAAASVAEALDVDMQTLIDDYTSTGDGWNIVYHAMVGGSPHLEFDALWDYLRDDCPYAGAAELYMELFNCEC